MKFKQIPVMGTNCYIFWDENSNNAVCIDPGFTGRKIAKEIQKLGLYMPASESTLHGVLVHGFRL